MTLREFLIRFSNHHLAVASLLLLLVFFLAAIFAPHLMNYDPNAIDLGAKLSHPSPNHLLGTDNLGRDLFTRLLYGGRVSLVVSILSVIISIILGVGVGLVAGYFGGLYDAVLMRLAEAILALPGIFVGLIVLTVFDRTIWTVVILIGFLRWVTPARLIRSEIIKYRTQEFILAARALGANDSFIIWQHLWPQTIPTAIVATSLGTAQAILIESSLSYLGLGIQPPLASWGNMLTGSQNYIFTSPSLALFPGLAIFLTVLAYNSIGDGVRDALDPRLTSKQTLFT